MASTTPEPAAKQPLRKRRFLLDGEMRREYHAARAFLAPQRDRVKQPMPPRP